MAIISGINLLSREKVRKLVIEKWGIAFTEVVRSMDGGDYCTTCMVCLQFQWDCIIFNRHIISMKSQGFFQTPQDIMEECNGCSVLQYTRYPLLAMLSYSWASGNGQVLIPSAR